MTVVVLREKVRSERDLKRGQAWGEHMPAILTLGRLSQEHCKFSACYIECTLRPYLGRKGGRKSKRGAENLKVALWGSNHRQRDIGTYYHFRCQIRMRGN